MGATAEDRVAKRKINELEQKLKKLQRELRQIKVDRKQVGSLRKQAERAAQTESTCQEIIEESEAIIEEENNKIKKKESKSLYRCKNVECIQAGGCYENTGDCDIIEVSTRYIVICKDCGSRYSVPKS